MTCEQMNELLDERAIRAGGTLPAPAADHLKACPQCGSLYEFLRYEPPEARRAGTGKGIAAAVFDSLEPVKPLVLGSGFVLKTVGAFVLLSLAGAGIMGGKALETMTWVQTAVMAAVATSGALLLSVSVGRQMIPAGGPRIPPFALSAGIVAALLAASWFLFPWAKIDKFVARGVLCSTAGLFLALPSAAVFWWFARRGVCARGIGGTLGVFSGLVGATSLQFSCPLLEAGHLTVWHVGIVAASTLIGLLADAARVHVPGGSRR